MTRKLFAGQLLSISCCGIVPLGAANIAFDSAADLAYSNGWQSGDNAGFGFTPWDFLPQGNTGKFMGTSTANGDGLDDGDIQGIAGDGDIDTAGRSWELFAGGTSNAYFNSMRVEVVPEPSRVVVLAFGCVKLTRRNRQCRE